MPSDIFTIDIWPIDIWTTKRFLGLVIWFTDSQVHRFTGSHLVHTSFFIVKTKCLSTKWYSVKRGGTKNIKWFRRNEFFAI